MNITGQEYGQLMAKYRRAGPWELDDITDSIEETGKMTSCELCGTEIRYVHAVSHQKLNEELEVGVCCAERLCRSNQPREAEEAFKSRQRRRATVLRQRQRLLEPDGWRRTMSGNLKRTIGGRLVVLFRKSQGYCLVIDHEFGRYFKTAEEALEDAFDVLYPFDEDETTNRN